MTEKYEVYGIPGRMNMITAFVKMENMIVK